MAYKGGIDYLELPFDGVDCEELGIRSPWTPESSGVWHTGDQAGIIELSAIAQELDMKKSPGQEPKVINDIPRKTDGGLFSI